MNCFHIQVESTNEALKTRDQTAELLVEKSRIAEEEAQLLSQKVVEAEKEMMKVQMAVIKVIIQENIYFIFWFQNCLHEIAIKYIQLTEGYNLFKMIYVYVQSLRYKVYYTNKLQKIKVTIHLLLLLVVLVVIQDGFILEALLDNKVMAVS